MTKLEKIRLAFADYVRSEGCSCCRDIEKHNDARQRMGELLGAPKFDDDSGYDFQAFREKSGGQ